MVSLKNQPVVSVIIPAWNEQACIADCLLAIDAQRFDGKIDVVVVANGCTDNTIAIVSELQQTICNPNLQIRLIETPQASKTNAINLAEKYIYGEYTICLDADSVLSMNTIHCICETLAQGVALLVSPKVRFRKPSGMLSALYLHVFANYPPMSDDVVGMGCYAINREGRRRWGDFPEIIADDAFVCSRFAQNERRLLTDAYFTTSFPSQFKLLPVLTRWHGGNIELSRLGYRVIRKALFIRRLGVIAKTPSVMMILPVYILLNLISKLSARLMLKKYGRLAWVRER